MAREKQISDAAQHYAKVESEKTWNHPDWEDVQWAFEAGAEWSDEHPNLSNWHKWSEERPGKNGDYLVYTESGDFVVDFYFAVPEKELDKEGDFYHERHWCRIEHDDDVEYWTELPETPKIN